MAYKILHLPTAKYVIEASLNAIDYNASLQEVSETSGLGIIVFKNRNDVINYLSIFQYTQITIFDDDPGILLYASNLGRSAGHELEIVEVEDGF